jgi:hypothetical protein
VVDEQVTIALDCWHDAARAVFIVLHVAHSWLEYYSIIS